jgi:hypothetical protein
VLLVGTRGAGVKVWHVDTRRMVAQLQADRGSEAATLALAPSPADPSFAVAEASADGASGRLSLWNARAFKRYAGHDSGIPAISNALAGSACGVRPGGRQYMEGVLSRLLLDRLILGVNIGALGYASDGAAAAVQLLLAFCGSGVGWGRWRPLDATAPLAEGPCALARDKGKPLCQHVLCSHRVHTFAIAGEPAVASACFSADGRSLATVATDGIVRLFDMASRAQTSAWRVRACATGCPSVPPLTMCRLMRLSIQGSRVHRASMSHTVSSKLSQLVWSLELVAQPASDWSGACVCPSHPSTQTAAIVPSHMAVFAISSTHDCC